MTYLPTETILDFIVNDFEDAWNSLAWNLSARGRGNFMFAMQGMTLLEFVCRLCSADGTSQSLRDFSDSFFKREPKYATALPGVCGDCADFDLPYKQSKGDELLWAIWDMIRNGQAHQYQQITVRLTDGKDWKISLTGAALGQLLQSGRPNTHLDFHRDQDGTLWLIVHPDMLFLDLKHAIVDSQILRKGLPFPYLIRPRQVGQAQKSKLRGPYYRFSSSDLETNLLAGGLTKCL